MRKWQTIVLSITCLESWEKRLRKVKFDFSAPVIAGLHSRNLFFLVIGRIL